MFEVLMVYLWQKIDGIIISLEKLASFGSGMLFWVVAIAVLAGLIAFITAPAAAPLSTDGVDANGETVPSIASRWKVWMNTLHLKGAGILAICLIVFGTLGAGILPSSKQMAGLVVTYAGVQVLHSAEAQKLLEVAKAEVNAWADGKLGAVKAAIPAASK